MNVTPGFDIKQLIPQHTARYGAHCQMNQNEKGSNAEDLHHAVHDSVVFIMNIDLGLLMT